MGLGADAMSQAGGWSLEYFYKLKAAENKPLGPQPVSLSRLGEGGNRKALYHPSFFELHRKSARPETGIWRGWGEGGQPVRLPTLPAPWEPGSGGALLEGEGMGGVGVERAGEWAQGSR